MDGYDKPLVLNAALTISDDGMHVDFDGTSPASSHGINVVYNYCLAYTASASNAWWRPRCRTTPARLRRSRSARLKAACSMSIAHGRSRRATRSGRCCLMSVFGCLHQAIAGGVPAEGASSLWNPQIFGGGSLVDEVGTRTSTPMRCRYSAP